MLAHGKGEIDERFQLLIWTVGIVGRDRLAGDPHTPPQGSGSLAEWSSCNRGRHRICLTATETLAMFDCLELRKRIDEKSKINRDQEGGSSLPKIL